MSFDESTTSEIIDGSSDEARLENILRCFKLEKDQLIHIMGAIESAFSCGLSNGGKTYMYRPVKMINTHLTVVPNGSETGRFVALDLGGTNLRVLSISIVNRGLSTEPFSFKVPSNIQNGSGEQLFDYIADRIEEGLELLGFKDVDIPYMGFTFSFPCHQKALNSGELIKWTKGYSASCVENHDVVALLRRACNKKNLKIHDFVLINDTVGTLLCGAFQNDKCTIGVINGTGTNACYIEKLSNVIKCTRPSAVKSVLINTEWGSFGENGELNEYYTDVDVIVDKQSINPRRQIFEKMVSGMYIGEIVRHLIINISDNGIIFDGDLPPNMKKSNAFPTSLTSKVYRKDVFIRIFKKHFEYNLDDKQYQAILKVCKTVVKRAAGLVAAGLSALLIRINRKFSCIAADGAVFKKHTTFLHYVKEYIEKILPKELEFDIITVEDGSGKGAALAASVVEDNLKYYEAPQ